MKKVLIALTFLLLVWAIPSAADNIAPPAGAILDLNGQPLPTSYAQDGYIQYYVDFTAALSSTDITFAFRNDSGFTAFDDVSVVDLTNPSGNLIKNGDFENGTIANSWNYNNFYGTNYNGYVSGNPCFDPIGQYSTGLVSHSGKYFWCDGTTQAYDAIDQVVATTPGDVYRISFWQTQVNVNDVSQSIYQALSNNGQPDSEGNGVDTLVYAGSTTPDPAPVPEPGTLMLLAPGLLVAAGTMRRKFWR